MNFLDLHPPDGHDASARDPYASHHGETDTDALRDDASPEPPHHPGPRPRTVHLLHLLPVHVVRLDARVDSATATPRASEPGTPLPSTPPRRRTRTVSLGGLAPNAPTAATAASVPADLLTQLELSPHGGGKWALLPRRGHAPRWAAIRALTSTCEVVAVGALGAILDAHGRALPEQHLSATDRAELRSVLWYHAKMPCVPVFLDKATADAHYGGYCKQALWPLLHYQLWDGATNVARDARLWAAYVRANRKYARAAAAALDPDGNDRVWVHDYHLLLVPAMLRALVTGEPLPAGMTAGDDLAAKDQHAETEQQEQDDAEPTDAGSSVLGSPTSAAVVPSVATAPIIMLFLHTPFPSSELFRCLPARAPLLHGMLGASLVGFQTWSYARHFSSACTRVLGLESPRPTAIEYSDGRTVDVGIFPMGIDVARTESICRRTAVMAKARALRDLYAGKKIVVGYDQLDQMRGVHQKLRAFAQFLENYPEYRGQVVLVQVTSPPAAGALTSASGSDGGGAPVHVPMATGAAPGHVLPAAAKLDSKLAELVADTNGRFGSLDYAPVHYIHRALADDEYYALLTAADAMITSSVRDGMATTCHEFVTAQQFAQQAPLLLSEFTGTAGSLGASAILVNPWDTTGVAAALAAALSMPDSERRVRHADMLNHVKRQTAAQWSRAVAAACEATALGVEREGVPHCTPPLDARRCVAAYRGAPGTRLFALDFDGTLSPIARSPEDAKPSQAVLDVLTALCADDRNRVVVISGRDQATLDAWLGGIPRLGLSAEHGCFVRFPEADDWVDLATEAAHVRSGTSGSASASAAVDQYVVDMGDLDAGTRSRTASFATNADHGPETWQAEVLAVFDWYTERTPGSTVEAKRHSLTWHYRRCDPVFGAFQARECQTHLKAAVLARWGLALLPGKKNLEVRPANVNKGEIVARLLARYPDVKFVLCAGDCVTDLDMFRRLRAAYGDPAGTTPLATPADANAPKVFTVNIGPRTKRTVADWHLPSPAALGDVLRVLAGMMDLDDGDDDDNDDGADTDDVHGIKAKVVAAGRKAIASVKAKAKVMVHAVPSRGARRRKGMEE
ncbi:threalose-6-phosphate phosphatase [Allomyces arbusculus]|nr:threalose-6-phosphate phosphatase [Allomyces arbusculus]